MLTEVTNMLCIGGSWLAAEPATLREAGVESVLKLCESPKGWPPGFALYDASFPDGEPIPGVLLDELVAFVRDEIESGHRVLVVCGEGISRSATIVLAYLVSSGMTLPEAYRLLRMAYPKADPHPVLWASLLEHYDLPYTWLDILAWRIETDRLIGGEPDLTP